MTDDSTPWAMGLTVAAFVAAVTAAAVVVLSLGLTRVHPLLAVGLTTRQVAERLVISAKTADHHVQHIYTKIGVSTRGAAALFAIEHGLLASAA